jgi:hypothetical protein
MGILCGVFEGHTLTYSTPLAADFVGQDLGSSIGQDRDRSSDRGGAVRVMVLIYVYRTRHLQPEPIAPNRCRIDKSIRKSGDFFCVRSPRSFIERLCGLVGAVHG